MTRDYTLSSFLSINISGQSDVPFLRSTTMGFPQRLQHRGFGRNVFSEAHGTSPQTEVTLVDHGSEEMRMTYLRRQRPTEDTCDVGFLFKHDPPFVTDVTRETALDGKLRLLATNQKVQACIFKNVPLPRAQTHPSRAEKARRTRRRDPCLPTQEWPKTRSSPRP